MSTSSTVRPQLFAARAYPKETMNAYQCDYCGNALDLDWCPETDVNYCGLCAHTHESQQE
jgi:hypothetical protein